MKKMLFFSLIIVMTVFCSTSVSASGYTADDNQIDQLFARAPESVNVMFSDLTAGGYSTTAFASSEKSAPVALLLDFFLGGLGVHRFYLGTEVMTGIGYILTCGGFFGVMPLIDFIVIIINIEDISQYVDNPKFFMW
jgi:TM2 domain-containing membrane protein YozV